MQCLLVLPLHTESALHPYQLEDSQFCLLLHTRLHIPCPHSAGHSMDKNNYWSMSWPSFWHLVFCFCPLHQPLHILNHKKTKKQTSKKTIKRTRLAVERWSRFARDGLLSGKQKTKPTRRSQTICYTQVTLFVPFTLGSSQQRNFIFSPEPLAMRNWMIPSYT